MHERAMGRVTAFEVPPPGDGFATVIVPFPTADRSAVVKFMISAPLLMYDVVRAEPFHCATDPLTNPEPRIVSDACAEPAVTHRGFTELRAGGGLPAGLTVKFVTSPYPSVPVNPVARLNSPDAVPLRASKNIPPQALVLPLPLTHVPPVWVIVSKRLPAAGL